MSSKLKRSQPCDLPDKETEHRVKDPKSSRSVKDTKSVQADSPEKLFVRPSKPQPIWKRPDFSPLQGNTPRSKLIKNAQGLSPVDVLNMDWSQLLLGAKKEQFAGIASIVTDYSTETSKLIMDTYRYGVYDVPRTFYTDSGIIWHLRSRPSTQASALTPEMVTQALYVTSTGLAAWSTIDTNEGRYVLRATLPMATYITNEYGRDMYLENVVSALREEYQKVHLQSGMDAGKFPIMKIVAAIRAFGAEIDTDCSDDAVLSLARRSIISPDTFENKFQQVASLDYAELHALDWSDLYDQCIPLISETRQYHGGELAYDGKKLKVKSITTGMINHWELKSAPQHLFRFVIHTKNQMLPMLPTPPFRTEIWDAVSAFVSRECVWYCVLAQEGLWILRPSDRLAETLYSAINEGISPHTVTKGIRRDVTRYVINTNTFSDYSDILGDIMKVPISCIEKQPNECIKQIGRALRAAGINVTLIPNDDYNRISKNSMPLTYWNTINHTEYNNINKMLISLNATELDSLDWGDVYEHLPTEWDEARLDAVLVDYGESGSNALYVVAMRKDIVKDGIITGNPMMAFSHFYISWRRNVNALPEISTLNYTIRSRKKMFAAWFVLITPEKRVLYRNAQREELITASEYERSRRLSTTDHLRALGFDVIELPPLTAYDDAVCIRIHTHSNLQSVIKSIPGLRESTEAELPRTSKLFDMTHNNSMYVFARKRNNFVGWCIYTKNVPQSVADAFGKSAEKRGQLALLKGWVQDIYVSQKHRRSGYARLIIRELTKRYSHVHVGIRKNDEVIMTLFLTEGFVSIIDDGSFSILKYTN